MIEVFCRYRVYVLLLLLIACAKSASFSSNVQEVRSVNKTEEFAPEKNDNRLLDILITLDTSGSMRDPVQGLGANLAPLLSHIENTDWQIAVTTINHRACHLGKLINKNNEDEFKDFVQGLLDAEVVLNFGIEQMALTSLRALRGDCLLKENAGMDIIKETPQTEQQSQNTDSECNARKSWLRDGSTVVVLLVSDEDHQCFMDEFGCGLTDLYFYLNSIRKIRSTAHVYGLLAEGVDTLYNQWVDDGKESLFTSRVNLCRDCAGNLEYYNDILEEISDSIASILQKGFTLSRNYDEQEATKVTVHYGNGKEKILKEQDYKISGDTLNIITKLPTDTEKVVVQYTYNPDS